jgi:hypothetical protein
VDLFNVNGSMESLDEGGTLECFHISLLEVSVCKIELFFNRTKEQSCRGSTWSFSNRCFMSLAGS